MFNKLWKAVGVLKKPKAAEANARGQEAMQRGDLEEAAEHFSTAIQCDPENAVLVYNRGFAYLLAEEWERARADFDRTIELTPDDADPYYRRGVCFQNEENYAAAMKDYNRAIKLQPQNSRFRNSRGVTYQAIGDMDKALADYAKALELDPSNRHAHKNRANVLELEGRYDEALQSLTVWLEADPESAEAWNKRGDIYRSKGDPMRAIAAYTKAIRGVARPVSSSGRVAEQQDAAPSAIGSKLRRELVISVQSGVCSPLRKGMTSEARREICSSIPPARHGILLLRNPASSKQLAGPPCGCRADSLRRDPRVAGVGRDLTESCNGCRIRPHHLST